MPTRQDGVENRDKVYRDKVSINANLLLLVCSMLLVFVVVVVTFVLCCHARCIRIPDITFDAKHKLLFSSLISTQRTLKDRQ